MEKRNENKLEEPRGNITLENRKRLTLTGVEEVISFDDEKILLNTKLGFLTIKGSELKMNKLDVQNGDVIIIGNISSIVYSSKEVKKEKENIISKLFK
ncbi:sporulation protein YabP [Clostridium tertium]|jgi:sporulation protein YabP|uniref:Sporulation protein YabP n=1 Tax=Clostridium tertium TaxID=1559 RepID=A0A9X4B186_9CLOT|nr:MULTISPECIES: sporulation protein YabP [Clostridium]EEH99480.1 sporulation protein YabP [Clostridium sp. 7_2_43FAA]MBP1867936.1 sporulation protein YabP [Clostridium tertium]MBS5308491.1 sporulation protein YabP [Clostridium sp.]MBS5884385.1 sporulation protein YabP [Clostridium sp.]MBS6503210.1 sporulation protein YabP [Clostridium sp.]